MRYTLLLLAFTALSATTLQAQLGIRAGYNMNDAPDWVFEGDFTSQADLLSDGYSFGIDYWLPMQSYRVDFLPELNYGRFTENALTEAQWFSFFLNTHFYFLDFEGDCDCPTFSKSGGAFQKGLFFQLSPGVTYQNATVNELENEDTEGFWSYSIGAGLGLDIGVSDFFTITPIVSYRYFLPSDWQALGIYENDDPLLPQVRSSESAINQIYTGVRLGFRFDQRY
ncbi:MAG: hypothetical protein GVY26_04660 [Bacteroidetes bacterium]|jgi:hypothetical protein|nr:hypothetical protein [Bacteroidota bacterium]